MTLRLGPASTGDCCESCAGRLSLKKACQVYLLPILVLIIFQIKAIHFWRVNNLLLKESELDSKIDQPAQSSYSDFRLPPLPPVPRNESFGACLMVKGDNDLLTEWVPYHYTVLPLRYLLVVTDAGNPEDPRSVLEKWTTADTDLHWWVAEVAEFENIHEEFDAEREIRRQGLTEESSDTIESFIAHRQLVHRQNAMITYCTKFMKERGVRWTSMYDTDEFLAINRIGSAERGGGKNTTDEAETLDETYGMRSQLPPMESSATVVDIIQSFERAKQPLEKCHVLPRVSFAATENFTCPGSEDIQNFARENFGPDRFNTLRYQQHAVKGNFHKNRWGKVFIDVSNISDETISSPPKNIHRPFRHECGRPYAAIEQAPFYLMHYVGGWERFKAKNDKRRGFEKWKELADVADSTSCCEQEVYRWLHRFVDQVGLIRAKSLLGE